MADGVTERGSLRGDGAVARGGGPVILDGDVLSRERAAALAERAATVTAERGHAPRLALIAFADAAGRGAYSGRKMRACAAAGVEAVPLIVPFETHTADALWSMRRLITSERIDALFVEFPFPAGVDGDVMIDAIPPALDVDVMTPARVDRFMSGVDPRPPLTVAAGLALLDRYDMDAAGLTSVVVGDDVPFTHMFAEAIRRRGAESCAVIDPAAAELHHCVSEAHLVVVTAARPHLVLSSALAEDAVAIDVGYFNAGGRGDIDTSPGIDHLAAFAPVPGGIGPMTISVLIERVIEFAEESEAS